MAKKRIVPDPLFTYNVVYGALSLMIVYLLFLTFFEIIEILRPKPGRNTCRQCDYY